MKKVEILINPETKENVTYKVLTYLHDIAKWPGQDTNLKAWVIKNKFDTKIISLKPEFIELEDAEYDLCLEIIDMGLKSGRITSGMGTIAEVTKTFKEAIGGNNK